MTSRTKSPLGAPCWADLWTSDVQGARKFYSELFGWEANEPSPEFGGYFMFTRNGIPVAGGMGDMGDMKANDTWKIYLDTDDIHRTVDVAQHHGAQVLSPATPVADLGTQFVFADPNGANLGAWQAGTFPGFTVMNEHGTPSWFELVTHDFNKAVSFYRDVFHWDTSSISDTNEFRYTVMRDPSGEGELAGVMDASHFRSDDEADAWSVYWHSDDTDATVAKALSLGGSLVMEPRDTPYGRLAALRDFTGARFNVRATS